MTAYNTVLLIVEEAQECAVVRETIKTKNTYNKSVQDSSKQSKFP